MFDLEKRDRFFFFDGTACQFGLFEICVQFLIFMKRANYRSNENISCHKNAYHVLIRWLVGWLAGGNLNLSYQQFD